MTDKHLELYERLGFNLIPLKPRDKRPSLASWAPYMERMSTADERKLWWPDKGVSYPNEPDPRNLGVVCGAISNLVVLDLDSEEVYKHVYDNDYDLCQTMTVTTGRGFHLYLRPKGGADPGQTFPMDVEGMDGKHHMKANGGYVVAPPSIHPNGHAYVGVDWTPKTKPQEIDLSDLVERLGRMGFKRSAPEGAELPQGWWDEFISGTHGEGARADALVKLMGILRSAIQSPAIAYELARCWNREHLRPPLTDGEVQRTVASYYRRYAD